MSSMIRPTSSPKRLARSTSWKMTSWKRRWLKRPVSSSVTAWRWTVSWRSTFSIETPACCERYVNSSRSGSENPLVLRATVSMPRMRPPSWARSGCESAKWPLRSVSTTSSAFSAADVGADAVDRGLDHDLQHRVALEALGERLADAADRLAQALALELQLL